VWCEPSDSSHRYGRGSQRARCGFSGETLRDGPLRGLRLAWTRLFGTTKPRSPKPSRSLPQRRRRAHAGLFRGSLTADPRGWHRPPQNPDTHRVRFSVPVSAPITQYRPNGRKARFAVLGIHQIGQELISWATNPESSGICGPRIRRRNKPIAVPFDMDVRVLLRGTHLNAWYLRATPTLTTGSCRRSPQEPAPLPSARE